MSNKITNGERLKERKKGLKEKINKKEERLELFLQGLSRDDRVGVDASRTCAAKDGSPWTS